MYIETITFDDNIIDKIERLREKEIKYLRFGLCFAFIWNIYTIYYYEFVNKN